MQNKNHKIKIIAELHPQHSGSMSLLKQMAYQSFIAGADSIKLQFYSTDDVPNGKSKKYLIFKEDEILEIKNFCNHLDLEVFFSAFNLNYVKILKKIGFKKIKIASRSNKNNRLINYCIDNFNEVIISTSSISKAKSLKKFDNVKVLYCVSEYPTLLENLSLPKEFIFFDGFSDHTIGCSAAYLAISRGAQIIEKHFSLSKSLQKTNEKAHICSMDMVDLSYLKKFILDFEIIKK